MRCTFIIIMLLVSLQISAQNLQTPEILSVSVDTVTGRPVVKWKIDDPSQVDGYVVKRLIYDGVGVMPDTYNNVAVIDNNNVFEWEDNSTDYSTTAQPSERVEKYRVAAFVDDGTQRKYSLMSDEMSTILLSVSYNKCTGEYSVKWTGKCGANIDYYYVYSGVDGFGSRNAVVNNDTTFATTFDDFSETRTFGVEAVLTNGESMFSTMARAFAKKVDVPSMSVNTVSVNAQNGFDVVVNVAESQDVVKTVLVRHPSYSPGGTGDTIELPLHTSGPYLITDQDVDVAQKYDYRIAVFGDCGTPLDFSPFSQNIVLNVEPADNTTNLLTWNSMPGISTEDYVIYSVDANGERTLLDNISMDTQYTHSLSNIIANGKGYDGRFCYQVSQTNYQSSFAQNGEVFSNIVCVEREPVLFVPNAINPDADILDNRYFRPRSGFLNDYKMNIYNKRGELLFTTNDPEDGWDGKNQSGKLYPPDAYVYVITYKTASGKSQQQSGFVNLVYQQ